MIYLVELYRTCGGDGGTESFYVNEKVLEDLLNAIKTKSISFIHLLEKDERKPNWLFPRQYLLTVSLQTTLVDEKETKENEWTSFYETCKVEYS